MTRVLSRQVVAAVLVALLVVTAGCSGLSGGDQADTGDDDEDEQEADDEDEQETDEEEETDEEAESTGTDMETDGGGMTVTSPGMDTETPSMDGSFGDYQWTEGERYTYEWSTSQTSGNEMTWEVTSISGDQLTVDVTGSMLGSDTFEGTQDQIFQEAANSQSVAPLFVGLRASTQVVVDHSLTVGNSWTISADELDTGSEATWETATVEVTGTDSYNGIECTNIRLEPDSDDGTPSTNCINPNYPFAIALTSEGDSTTTIELTDSSR